MVKYKIKIDQFKLHLEKKEEIKRNKLVEKTQNRQGKISFYVSYNYG